MTQKSVRIFYDKAVLADGAVVEMVIWTLPKRNEERPHGLKYRLCFGRAGQGMVGYDNERESLNPKRLDLLTHVRQRGAQSVRHLAQALQRDYKNVHQDVALLESVGLLVRDGRKLSAPWDEVQAKLSLLSSA